MIRYKIRDQIINAETDAKELTTERYLLLLSKRTALERISALTGYDCGQLSFSELYDVMSYHVFLYSLETQEHEHIEVDAGSKTWAQVIACEQALKRHDGQITAAIEVCQALGGKGESIGEVLSYFSALMTFFNEFADLSEWKPSDMDMAAGYGKLQEMGFMVSATALAERFGKDIDEVLQWQARKVYNIFQVDYRKANYEHQKRELESRLKKK